ncbi:DUF6602 domain-containing protein [Clostridium sp. OS1-26]|uniref:DUF6602 domain-containing protein n=1 Tax=Clostridium sp. OS1-26 TaxID=3070681 RepID=UPI0027E0B5F2|nr:DUF6602 domain-containing protein [Clostridium sp. OS1-26]WML34446.1 hypothetical protein RCG18_24700 [Clostridium sp. OS1-26]
MRQKIEQFIRDFKYSSSLFEDLNKKNNLIHAGEYGSYRENICKKLLEFAIPSKYQISSGFILNPQDEVSTQIDILIYDFNNTPLIEIDENTKFFPTETVIGIGEIKSTLDKNALFEALIKLAKNKAIRKIQNPCRLVSKTTGELNYNNPYELPFSFLICESIKNFNSNIIDEIESFYEKNGIESCFKHNAILSINDGLFIYSDSNYKLKKIYNIDIDKEFLYFPRYGSISFDDQLICSNSTNNHIIKFLVSLSNFIFNVQEFYPEIGDYLELTDEEKGTITKEMFNKMLPYIKNVT